MKTPAVVRKVTAGIAIAVALAVTPLLPFGVVSFADAPVSIAGGSYPDDVDPG